MHGPGDLRGQPAQLDDEKRALVYRMYEIYPPEHPEAGRRRFKRVALSLAKGLAKTEFTAWISAAELRPDARPLRRLRPAGQSQRWTCRRSVRPALRLLSTLTLSEGDTLRSTNPIEKAHRD